MSTNVTKEISRRFPGHSKRDFKKNPGHVCIASACLLYNKEAQQSPAQRAMHFAEICKQLFAAFGLSLRDILYVCMYVCMYVMYRIYKHRTKTCLNIEQKHDMHFIQHGAVAKIK